MAQLARLGLATLIAAAVLAVLVLATGCWVLASDARAGRLAPVLGAWRGDAALADTPAGAVPAARRGRGWRWRRPLS